MLGQMLGDPEFYTACPYFLHMRELGIACYTKYIDGLTGTCVDCKGDKLLRPAIGTFVAQVKLLLREHPIVLEGIKAYIGNKRGKRPPAVVLTCRIDGEVCTLRF